jgi:dolichol-phosphate mannosyltransferase
MRGAPLLRSLLSHAVARLLRTFVGLPGVRDYSTFYRGFRVGLLRAVFARWGEDAVKGHGFACMARFLILAGGMAREIREVPFTLRYDLKEGGSGMRIFRTMRGYVGVLAEHGRWPGSRRRPERDAPK